MKKTLRCPSGISFWSTSYLERPGAGEVESLPVPEVSLCPVSYPQHAPAAGSGGPQVHRQAEHMGAVHVVMEAEHAVLAGRVLAALARGLEDPAQQHGGVLELLGGGGLDVEVVAQAGAQRVVLQGPRVDGRSRALHARPVEHVASAHFLSPAAQAAFEVTLQLRSCGNQTVRWTLTINTFALPICYYLISKRGAHRSPPRRTHPRSHPQGHRAAGAPRTPSSARSGNVCASGTLPPRGASSSSRR